MRLQRTRNTKRNIMVGEADKMIGILLPFLVRTLIIHLMAAEYLGLMSLYYSIIQMLNLAEMGFGSAITYSMYKPIADNDQKKINALLAFYKKVYFYAGLIVTAVGLSVLFFLPKLITGNIPEDTNIYLLYLIFLGNATVNFFLFPEKKALMTAHQRDDLIGRVHILSQLGMYALQIAAVLFTRNFYLYALVIPVSSIAFNFLCAHQTARYYPECREEGTLDREEFLEIRRQVVGISLRKLASMSRNAFDSMFVSAYLGLGITAIYGNYYYIMDAVVMLLAVVKTSMAGGVGNSIAMSSVEKNHGDMKTIHFLYMLLGGWCSVFLLCLYQPFMEIWVGQSMMFSMDIAALFALYFYILKMADIRTLYAESVGIWWQARYLSVAEAAANLILNYLLIRWIGVRGIILATLISYFIFNYIGGAVVLFSYYFTDGGLSGYFRSDLCYLMVTLAAAGLTFYCTQRLPFAGWAHLILCGLLCMLIPGIFYLLFYYQTKEFKHAFLLLKRMFGVKAE